MNTAETRGAILRWFADQAGEWVPFEAFLAAWGDRVSTGQGKGDLRWLVKHGHLEKRLDHERRTVRGLPTALYRVRLPR